MKDIEKQKKEETPSQELPEEIQTLDDEDLEEVAGGWTEGGDDGTGG